MQFSYTSGKQGNIHVLSLQGELIEKDQAGNFLKEVDDILASGHVRFIVDLHELKYLNSSGLNVLIQILTRARKAGGEAVIAHVGNRIKELLVITKLNTVFTVTDTVEQGIAKLNEQASN